MEEVRSTVKKVIASVAHKAAEISANSNSCIIMHQAKIPEELKKFRKIK